MKRKIVLGVLLASFCSAGAGLWARQQTRTKPARAPRSPVRPVAEQDRAAADLYVVKKGDSLYGIAGSHGTTVAVLKSINHLSGSRLRIGQRLRLHAPRPAAVIPAKSAALLLSTLDSAASSAASTVADGSTSYISSLDERGDAAASKTGSDPEANPEYTELPLRMRLAGAGLGFLGTRYRWTGTSEHSGFDCSGFVKHLFEKFDIVLPRSSREQYKVGEKVDKDKLEVGDLVFFSSRGKTPTHVGVYLGDNMFLHAARKARDVIISNLSAAWYSKRFLGARRMLDLWEPEPKPAETPSP